MSKKPFIARPSPWRRPRSPRRGAAWPRGSRRRPSPARRAPARVPPRPRRPPDRWASTARSSATRSESLPTSKACPCGSSAWTSPAHTVRSAQPSGFPSASVTRTGSVPPGFPASCCQSLPTGKTRERSSARSRVDRNDSPRMPRSPPRNSSTNASAGADSSSSGRRTGRACHRCAVRRRGHRS